MELRNSKAASGGDVTNWNGLELVLHPPKQIMCSEERWLLSSKQKTLVILWSSWITTHHKFHPFFSNMASWTTGPFQTWTLRGFPSQKTMTEHSDTATQRHVALPVGRIRSWTYHQELPGWPNSSPRSKHIKTLASAGYGWLVTWLRLFLGHKTFQKVPWKEKKRTLFWRFCHFSDCLIFL